MAHPIHIVKPDVQIEFTIVWTKTGCPDFD